MAHFLQKKMNKKIDRERPKLKTSSLIYFDTFDPSFFFQTSVRLHHSQQQQRQDRCRNVEQRQRQVRQFRIVSVV